MIKGIIHTGRINDLELDIEDLYSKQTVRLLKYERGEYYTKVEYSGLNPATIKSCINVYKPDLLNELVSIIKMTNDSGMDLSILRNELTKMTEEL